MVRNWLYCLFSYGYCRLVKIKQWVDEHAAGASMIPFCAELEQTAATMEGEANEQFWKDQKAQSAVSKIIRTGYHCLSLIHFFTCGPDEVRCWTVRVCHATFPFLVYISHSL